MMNTTDRITQEVQVGAFDCIVLQAINIENELIVGQGKNGSLTIETERLHVKFGGPGHLTITGLNARRLDVDVTMPSPCQIVVSGQVGEQHITRRISPIGAVKRFEAVTMAGGRSAA